MHLQELTDLGAEKTITEEFTGYDNVLRTGEGEWHDMLNCTTDYYPVASTREHRSTQENKPSIKKVVGLRFDSGELTDKEIELKDILDLSYLDGNMIELRNAYDGDTKIGNWFVKNGEPIPQYKESSAVITITDASTSNIEVSTSTTLPTITTITISGVSNEYNVEVGEYIDVYPLDTTSTFPTINEDYIGYEVTQVNSNSITAFREAYALNPTKCDTIKIFREKYALLDKMQYFDTNSDEKHLIRNGSYVVTIPDGIVYETNSDEEVPVKKINVSKEYAEIDGTYREHLVFRTCVKNDNGTYSAVTLNTSIGDGHYRIVNSKLQKYVVTDTTGETTTGLWMDCEAYTEIYLSGSDNPANYTYDCFDGFQENDSVTIKCNSTSIENCCDNFGLIQGETKNGCQGIISYDDASSSYTDTTKVILKKGSLSDGRVYIIVSGVSFCQHKELEEDSYMYYEYEAYNGHIKTRRDSLQILPYFMDKGNFEIYRKFPDVSYGCECQNRVWLCDTTGHEFYASAQGNPYAYYDYSGLVSDSWAVTIGTDGKWTGCVNYLGTPMMFKENSVCIVSGYYPDNTSDGDSNGYSVTTYNDFKGVEKGSDKSFAIIDNVLYYKSSIGIIAYDGNTTTLISSAFGKDRYKNAVASVYENKYYVSMQNVKDGKYYVFVYDTSQGTWSKEDETQVGHFVNVSNELLFSTTDSKIKSVVDYDILGNEEYEKEGAFDFSWTTGDYGYSYANNKYLSRFQIRMNLSQGSSASFYIQYNSDGVWHRKGEMKSNSTRSYLFPIVPIRCDHCCIKIAGTGDCKIYSIAKYLEESGEDT